MSSVLKIILGALIAVLLGLALQRQGKDIALLLSVLTCCMVAAVGISYLTPVIDFVQQLYEGTNSDPEFLRILLKSVGIGLVAEIASLMCKDTGNAALAKTVQILATAVILWLALPLMNALLELVRKIMEET